MQQQGGNPFTTAIEGAQKRRAEEKRLAQEYAISQGFNPNDVVKRSSGWNGMLGGHELDPKATKAGEERRLRRIESEKLKLRMTRTSRPRPVGGKVYHLSNSRVFHRPSCSSIRGETNLGEFSSRGKAIKTGAIPCKSCNP